jgi:hypothetical protein
VFYAPEHPSNKSYPLPGVEQTNQRAELHAVISAIESEFRFLEIRSDSKYVCDGFASIQNGTYSEHLSGDNADLWLVLLNTLGTRQKESVIVTKVKGHAKERHVASGEVLPIDKWGNDSADALAVKGGEVHEAPAHVVAAFKRRRKMSRATHRMMLRIVEARQRAEAILGLGNPDKHDEECEDPWQLDTSMSVPHPRSGEG